MRLLIMFGVLFSAAVAWSLARQAKYSRQRRGGFPEYLASFGGDDLPSDVQRAVYTVLRQGLWVKFSARADDSLEEVYGLVGDDVAEFIAAVGEACNRVVASEPNCVRTVRDVVWVVAGCPRAAG